MAKKFLLYIHRAEFEDEEKKSGLVNTLLDSHYDSTRPRKEPKPDIVRSEAIALCNHFAAKGFCKDSACAHYRNIRNINK